MLSFDELKAEVESGDDRHGRRRLHRHAGPPAGKAAPRRVLRRGGRGRARGRGLQLPARAGHGDGADPGLRDRELGAGLRRLRARRRISARSGASRGSTATALVLCDVQWHDGSPVEPSPRQVLKAQMERAAALGLTPMTGSELEFYLLRQTLRGGLGAALRGPDAVRPVHPRLPRSRHDLRRGSHPPDPERDARGRHQGRDLEGRGLARPARDQLPLRGRADDGRQPRRLQERREGDRAR